MYIIKITEYSFANVELFMLTTRTIDNEGWSLMRFIISLYVDYCLSRIRRDRNSAYKTYLKYCQRVYKIIEKLEYICKAHDVRAASLV
jgi:hypothetical protein